MEHRPKCKGQTVEYLIDSTEKQMLGNYTFQTSNGYNVEIKQRPHRIIDVSATEEVDIDVLYSILTKLEKLLMMMDGRFHVVERLYFHDSSTSKESDLIIAATHTLNHRLSLYSSRDFLKYACNKLIDYHDILDAELFDKWCVLLEQLDVVHQVFLYALADIKQPIDMICAFLIECAEPLIEIINDKGGRLSNPKPNGLKECIKSVIESYGSTIFKREILKGDPFYKAMRNSRVRIMHIKKRQEGAYFDGNESLLYAWKTYLLYRSVCFSLMEIDVSLYTSALDECVKRIDEHLGIVDCLMRRL